VQRSRQSTINVPGYILLDNTFGGTGGSGGTPTSGFINYSNASTLAGGGIQANGALTGTTVTLTGTGFNAGGVTVGSSAPITATAGSINITGISDSTSSNGSTINAQLRTTGTTGDINVLGMSKAGHGVLINAANLISDNGSIGLYGSVLTTGAATALTQGVYIANTTQIVSAKQNLEVAGYSAATSQYGIYSGGPLLAGGNISLGGYGASGGVWLGNPGVYYAGGNLTITGSKLVNNMAAV